MVHIVRPVWEKVGQDNQLGRQFPPLTYTAGRCGRPVPARAGAANRSRRPRSAERRAAVRQRLRPGLQAAALKPADYFGNDDVLYLMEDMATGEIRLSILWEWLHKNAALTAADDASRRQGGRSLHAGAVQAAARRGVREAPAGRQPRRSRRLEEHDAADRPRDRRDLRARTTSSCRGTSTCSTSTSTTTT